MIKFFSIVVDDKNIGPNDNDTFEDQTTFNHLA
jgi:hypothetical protein